MSRPLIRLRVRSKGMAGNRSPCMASRALAYPPSRLDPQMCTSCHARVGGTSSMPAATGCMATVWQTCGTRPFCGAPSHTLFDKNPSPTPPELRKPGSAGAIRACASPTPDFGDYPFVSVVPKHFKSL